MVRSLRARSQDSGFVAIATAASPAPGRENEFLSDLTATFARLYTAHVAHAPIPFIHAVTGPAALRLLLPYLHGDDQIDAMIYAWQSAAGLWSSFAPVSAAIREDRNLPR